MPFSFARYRVVGAMPNGKPSRKPLDIKPQPSHRAAPSVLLL
jgi:hypothetical protein